jgi:putative hemolysin
MEITLLFFLILLNGAFAMSEIALVAARKGRLQKLADEGDHGAARALELNQEPTRFLSTVQIGITSIAILNGIVGEAVLAEPLARWLEGQGVRHQWSGST